MAPDSHPSPELDLFNLPNLLTMLRIVLVPVIVALLFRETDLGDWLAVSVFIVAAVTDYFDGYFARTRNLVTVYGKFMDPLADKFLVVCSLIMLQELERIDALVVMLLICREIAITGLRAVASAEEVVIAASDSGKWKAAIQMVAIPMIFAPHPLFGIPFREIGSVLLYASLGVSLWSAKKYIFEFFRVLALKRFERVAERRAARQIRKGQRSERLAAKAKKYDL